METQAGLNNKRIEQAYISVLDDKASSGTVCLGLFHLALSHTLVLSCVCPEREPLLTFTSLSLDQCMSSACLSSSN